MSSKLMKQDRFGRHSSDPSKGAPTWAALGAEAYNQRDVADVPALTLEDALDGVLVKPQQMNHVR